MAFVTLALLHGNLDFTRTITTAVMCGTDTDCNSGTAGSIVGAAVGYEGLDPRWVAPLNDTVKTAVAFYGQGTITELVQRTLDVYRKAPYARLRAGSPCSGKAGQDENDAE